MNSKDIEFIEFKFKVDFKDIQHLLKYEQMTSMLNITLSGIKDLNVFHQVNKGRVKVWEIKGILIQILFYVKLLFSLLKVIKV